MQEIASRLARIGAVFSGDLLRALVSDLQAFLDRYDPAWIGESSIESRPSISNEGMVSNFVDFEAAPAESGTDPAAEEKRVLGDAASKTIACAPPSAARPAPTDLSTRYRTYLLRGELADL